MGVGAKPRAPIQVSTAGSTSTAVFWLGGDYEGWQAPCTGPKGSGHISRQGPTWPREGAEGEQGG